MRRKLVLGDIFMDDKTLRVLKETEDGIIVTQNLELSKSFAEAGLAAPIGKLFRVEAVITDLNSGDQEVRSQALGSDNRPDPEGLRLRFSQNTDNEFPHNVYVQAIDRIDLIVNPSEPIN